MRAAEETIRAEEYTQELRRDLIDKCHVTIEVLADELRRGGFSEEISS